LVESLTSALFIALRIFPTVSVKVLPSILPSFLYKEPKHTTAALKQHLNQKLVRAGKKKKKTKGIKKILRTCKGSQSWWLMLVILAIQEAEIWRFEV
jgi:hypothetical protein